MDWLAPDLVMQSVAFLHSKSSLLQHSSSTCYLAVDLPLLVLFHLYVDGTVKYRPEAPCVCAKLLVVKVELILICYKIIVTIN